MCIKLGTLPNITPFAMISESQLLGLSQEKFKKWEQSDLASIAQVFDEQSVLIWINGKCQTKSEMLQLFHAGKISIKNLQLQNTFARVYGSKGVVHGEGAATLTVEGKDLSGDLRFLDVWVERENGWKIVSSHFNQVL